VAYPPPPYLKEKIRQDHPQEWVSPLGSHPYGFKEGVISYGAYPPPALWKGKYKGAKSIRVESHVGSPPPSTLKEGGSLMQISSLFHSAMKNSVGNGSPQCKMALPGLQHTQDPFSSDPGANTRTNSASLVLRWGGCHSGIVLAMPGWPGTKALAPGATTGRPTRT